MYTREIQPPAVAPVFDGKPIQGTWARPFEHVRLLDIARPFTLPVRPWFVDFRIKEWQSFIVQNDEIFFEALIANLKFFRFIEVTFLDRRSGDVKYYFDYFPFAFWTIPDSLFNSALEYSSLGYSIRIEHNLEDSQISFSFSINPMNESDSLEAYFDINLDGEKSPPMVTSLLLTENKSAYSYKNTGAVTGFVQLDNKREYQLDAGAFALVRDCKGIFPYVMQSSWVNGFSIQKDGRLISFSVAENQARSPYKDNENALWVAGALTPLPPVRITFDEGHDKCWVIEDVEGMVDISFTPQHQTAKKSFDILLAKAEFFNPIGVFNGMLMTKDGEELHLRNVPGCAEHLYLRL